MWPIEPLPCAFADAVELFDGNDIFVGSDLKKGKKTFPAFYGLDESRRRAVEVADKAVASLQGFGRKADPLRELAKYIVTRVN